MLTALHPSAARVGDPGAARLPALRFEAQAVALGPSRVLLVDDNHHHRIPIRRALRDQGHDVLYASDGASGEAIGRASQLEIDALVACADMKHMSGFELGRRMRRMRPDLRVLLMSRHGPEEAHRAHERGYAVIEEPFTPEQLCRELRGLLASPHNDRCAELRLVGQDRLLPREDEALAMAPGTRTDTQGDPDGTNPTSKLRR
jgi:DNA-binding response OmpR family regulator